MINSKLSIFRRNICEVIGWGKYSRMGLNDLDRRLEKYLNFKNGYFIEAGANDGLTQSNTYYLEKIKGWRGILVEPIPDLANKAKQRRLNSRIFQNALVPLGRDGEELQMIYGNLMSIVSGAMGNEEADSAHINQARTHDKQAGSYKVSVIGRPLSAIIEEAKLPRLDFLSLDVEGYEANALRGLNFDLHRPTYICVEARYREEVDAVLLHHYNFIEHLSGMDRLYCVKK